MRVILASASPRRRELLKQIFDEYEVIPSNADETCDEKDPELLVEQLSLLKAKEVYERAEDDSEEDLLVIGSDTVVAIGGRILGKPKDREDAVDMLRLLSGNTHQVCTGVTVLYRKRSAPLRSLTFHETTNVTFFEMTEQETADYVASGEPMDKAGAYGIQGIGGRFIRGIDGDYNTVVGFPVARLYHELKDFIG